nr:MAG TPA: nucleoid-associated protein [Caudoviricetes sp.]
MYFGNFHKVGRCFMDVMLDRILSLIPHKPDGKFVHGAIKEFANKLGLKSGNVVSDWMNGRSNSYSSYIYQIADIYNVSVEWLKGETDDPTPKNPAAQTGDGEREQLLSAIDRALFELTEEQKLEALRYVWSLQGKEDAEK